MIEFKERDLKSAIKKYATHPFFGVILRAYLNPGLKVQLVMNPKIKTARIFLRGGSHLTVEVSPHFYQLYVKTYEDLVFLLAHEILHYILGHLQDGRIYTRRYGGGVANYGEDVVINHMIYRALGESARDLNIINFYIDSFRKRLGLNLLDCPYTLPLPEWCIKGKARKRRCEEVRTLLAGDNLPFIVERVIEHLLEHMGDKGDCDIPDIVEESEVDRDTIEETIERFKKKHGYGYGGKADERKIALARAKLKKRLIDAMIDMASLEEGGVERFSKGSGVLPFYSRKDFVFLGCEFPVFIYHGNPFPEKREGIVVYLDVSGSMNEELPHILSALISMRHLIRYPIYGFSTEVFPISLRDLLNGRFVTTGGTDFRSFEEHMLKNRIEKAVVITDGHAFPPLNPSFLKSKVHILTVLTGDNEKIVREFSKEVIKWDIEKG